jgi:subtilisin-like proprotein convertase family protein
MRSGLRVSVAVAVIVSLLGATAGNSVGRSPGDAAHLYVVSADSPEQSQALADSSARVVARYEAFALVEASGEDATALSDAGADRRDDMRLLTVDGRSFDPASDRAALVSKASEPDEAGLALVQFVGPIKDAWLDRLEKTGVRVVTYMAENGYLVQGSAGQLSDLGALVGSDPAVRAVVPYRVADKIAAGVGSGEERLAVQTLSGADGAGARAEVHSAGGETRDTSAVGPFRTQHVRADAGEVAEIAADPGVIAVLPDVRPELLDERQDQILANNITPPGPSGPGYLAFHDALPLGTTGTFGFTVDVTDEGLDDGNLGTTNADFYEGGSFGNPSRVTYVHDQTVDGNGRDCGGHGTINAGIIAGFNTSTGSSGTGAVEDAQGFNYGLGVAPHARVGASKIFRCTGSFGLIGTYTNLTRLAYIAGARISNNSWGANVGGAYNADSQEYDRLVRDADPIAAGNQEMVELFSAGNAGPGANTVGSPGTAKNVITVGASEGVEASGTTDGCGVGPTGADNFRDMASFSSRGPTDDQRTKPDLVGPGTHISGPHPQHALYDGNGVCDQTFPAGNTLYSRSSGTSHSTPAVSGVAALIRQWYQTNVGGGTTPPSPAMTKAILAQASTDLNGGAGAGGNVPNQVQGWGLENIAAALSSIPRFYRDQQDVFGATGEASARTFAVQDNGQPVRVTLAWTDTPGPTTGSAFVNNLDLTVASGAGTFKGNVFSGGQSVTGGTADFRNNLESVYLPAGTSGNFTVSVTAANIAGDGVPGNANLTDQDFALLVSNAAEVNAPALTGGSTAVTDGSPGDGDGDLEPGEGFQIQQTLRNVGTAGATGINGTLTGPATVSLSDPTAAWPDLGVGAAAANSDPLAGTLSDTATCGDPVDLSLAITTNEGADTNVPITIPTGTLSAPVARDSTDVPKSIPDNNAAGVTSTLSVADPGRIADVDVRLASLAHTFDGDLVVSLTSPAGTTVTLANRVGGGGDNFVNTVFDDEAAATIGSGNAAPFSGSFRPNGDQLSRFDGEDQQGTWTLKVADLANADTGTLNNWGHDITTVSCDFVPGARSISIDDVTVTEGNSGQTTATLTVAATPSTGQAISFDYATANGTAAQPGDYAQTSGSKNIPGGASSTTIDVTVNGDTVDESDESFTVDLSNVNSPNTLGDGGGQVTIADDDSSGGGGGGGDGGGTPDTSPPDTTIDSGPPAKTKKKKATFTFHASESPAAFQCKLDGGAFATCSSPATFTVKKGRHSLQVRAIDASNNVDPTPATDSWKVKKKRHRH